MSARTFPPADLRVMISAWEIECCAPPPIVGESTSWRLAFAPIVNAEPTADEVPGSVTQQLWQVEAWPGDGDRRALYRNDVAAYYYRSTDASSAQPMTPPPLGRHLLRGVLFGTRHGGSDYDLSPMVSATVTRIQLITCDLRQEDGIATAVPGSIKLADVRQSPKWFTRRPPRPVVSVPTAGGGQWRRRVVPAGLVYRTETGILLTFGDSYGNLPQSQGISR